MQNDERQLMIRSTEAMERCADALESISENLSACVAHPGDGATAIAVWVEGYLKTRHSDRA